MFLQQCHLPFPIGKHTRMGYSFRGMTASLASSQNSVSLPTPRGRLREGVPLANRCWFGVGGAAQWLFTPEDAEDLAAFLKELPVHIPVTVIGVGSNLLVRDGGIEGVVIRLGRGFTAISHEGDVVHAGAAALDVHVARFAAEAGVGGLEFLVGIPGTIGGAVKMNAGAYGADVAGRAISITAIDRAGVRHTLSAEEAGFSYRHSAFPDDWVVISAEFQGTFGDPAVIHARMEEISANREATQPVRSKTGGSTFQNPDGHKAWQLIDDAGCRGLRYGEAGVSELHCNFLINHGNATADDLESLGEEVRSRVLTKSGVSLEWEIKRIGYPLLQQTKR
jgi:UDP-N-acetylmuramate dehydrogenase